MQMDFSSKPQQLLIKEPSAQRQQGAGLLQNHLSRVFPVKDCWHSPGHWVCVCDHRKNSRSIYIPRVCFQEPRVNILPSLPAPGSPESPAQLVVVHLGLAFPPAPQPGHLVWVLDDELPVFTLLPGDHVPELLLLQQLQDEVPELDLAGAWAGFGLVRPVREMIAWQAKKQIRGSERSGNLQANNLCPLPS